MGVLRYAASGMGALFNVVNESVSDVIGAMKAGLARVAEGVRDGWIEMIDRFRNPRNPVSDSENEGDVETADELIRLKNELLEVNDRIMALRALYYKNGGLSDGQKDEWNSLRKRRKDICDRIDAYREVETASKIVREEEFVRKLDIDKNNVHILEFNAFANILGKTCSKCGRAMKIQWRNGLGRVGPSDMFWGCTGWYVVGQGGRSCSHKEPVTRGDLKLMACADVPEYSVSYDDFSDIFSDPTVERIVDERVSDLVSDLSSRKEGVYLAYCPVHGEGMRLRRKRESNGLLDTYFLSCRCWKPDGQGCQFVEKLRSPAQLSALLRSETGRGAL